MSWAKISGAIMGLIALIPAVFILLGGLFLAAFGESDEKISGIFVLLLSLFIPVLYFFFGFIGGFIQALIYNIIAGRLGGVKVEISSIKESGLGGKNK